MFKRIICISIIAAFAVIGQTIDQAVAQPAQTMRVNGTVESFDRNVLAIKSDKLGEVKINLTGNATVFGVSKAMLADVKPNSFIGVGAMPQPDGTQRAIQVTVFAETQRGIGEGHRPWDARPNSTMTNGAVAETVGGVDGPVLTVKYKDGEKKIVVPPDATILAYAVGDKSELKPGVGVAVLRAVKKPDGSLEADRVNVGRGGMMPQ
jgi:hypothetical protein